MLESDKFASIAQQQYTNTGKQTAQRGRVLAEDGTILAVDQPAWNVYASLSTDKRERELFFSKKDLFVSTVASILAVETETIKEKLTDDFVYVNLAKEVDNETKIALASANIFGNENINRAGFGLYFERALKRVYPNGELASHVIGFIGKTVKERMLDSMELKVSILEISLEKKDIHMKKKIR